MAKGNPIQPTPSIAVGLARCSTDKQDQSIASQRAEFECFAAKQGMQLVDVFEDEGVSGSKVADRPGVRALFKFLKTHPRKGTVLAVRPEGAREAHPIVSAFIDGSGAKICALEPVLSSARLCRDAAARRVPTRRQASLVWLEQAPRLRAVLAHEAINVRTP